jgi:predicted permease
MFSIGVNIVEGLWNGIESLAGWVVNQVENWASDISHAFSHVLSIFSPSKVFYGHGQNIALGVANGITDNASIAISAVKNLGSSVSSAFVSSIGKTATSSAGAGGGGGQTTNNFNITGFVTNPDQIARQIAQMLNDYQRHNGKEALFA